MAHRPPPRAARPRRAGHVPRVRDLRRQRRKDDRERPSGAERGGRETGESAHVPRVCAQPGMDWRETREEVAGVDDREVVGRGGGEGREADAGVAGYQCGGGREGL